MLTKNLTDLGIAERRAGFVRDTAQDYSKSVTRAKRYMHNVH
jgi:hypothetical protein